MNLPLPNALRASALIPPTARVLVALSGGPDSCALLLALCALADAGHLPRPVGAAHFHHGLRGADADTDAAFSAALCARRGVPCVVGLGAAQPERGESPNAAARRARYDFLAEAARDLDADTIATAHTRDDQAETVLGRILRGTSVDGLAGIPARRELSDGLTVVRPLLGVRRAEIEAYCADCGVVPRRDPSNEVPRYTRSRIRRRLPELAAEFNPQLTDALVRLSAQAAQDSDYLSNIAEAFWRDNVRIDEVGPIRCLYLPIQLLREAHPALRSRILLRALRESALDGVSAEQAATMAFVQRLEALFTVYGSINLPGGTSAYGEGTRIRIEQNNHFRAPRYKVEKTDKISLSVPGEAFVETSGLYITARKRLAGEQPQRERRSLNIDIAYNLDTPVALVVRPAHAGERFSPLGMGGRTRTIRDLLADARVPVAQRETAPIVARADNDEPLWIVGVCQAEWTRVAEDKQNANVLRLTAVFDRDS